MDCFNPHLGDELAMDEVVAGRKRLTRGEATRLLREASLRDLGRWASGVADRLHGSDTRTYVIDRNVNYTNVCSASCTFCAFYRKPGDSDAYTLSTRELHDKVRELTAIGGTQVLLQGGMHPDLPLSFYLDLLAGLKAQFPQVHIHGFSPPEFVEFVAVLDVPGFETPGPRQGHKLAWEVWRAKLDAIMAALMDAGLDSIPGGGAEIFAPHVRRRIGLGKATADQWLEVMAAGHRLGMFTSATMMFGHIEGLADRIDHLLRVREAQARAIAEGWPGRYVSFIAWPFQRENTPLGRVPDWDMEAADGAACEGFPGDVLADAVAAGEVDPHDKAACDALVPGGGKMLRTAGGTEYLRTQAVSRLVLDNIHSIGSSWVTMGPRLGEMGLFYGANDMGSVMMEENVVSAAGTTYCLSEPTICRLIRDAGYTPAQRDNRYRLLKLQDGEEAPDRTITDWSTQRARQLHAQTPAQGNAEPVTLSITPRSENASVSSGS